MAATSTLTDDFSGTLSKWATVFGNTSIINGKCWITADAANHFSSLATSSTTGMSLDYVEGEVYVQGVSTTPQAFFGLQALTVSGNRMGFAWSPANGWAPVNQVGFANNAAGTGTNVVAAAGSTTRLAVCLGSSATRYVAGTYTAGDAYWFWAPSGSNTWTQVFHVAATNFAIDVTAARIVTTSQQDATSTINTSVTLDAFNLLATAPPTAPGGVTASVASPTSATVAFTPGALNGGTLTNYTVTSNPGALTATGTASPITVTGLTTGTTYTFTVTTTSNLGTSKASPASNAVTPAAGVAPGAPTIGTATVNNTTAGVAFTPSTTQGNGTSPSYTLYDAASNAVLATGAGSPLTATGLTVGTTYSFYVTESTTFYGSTLTSSPSSTSNTVTPATSGSGGGVTTGGNLPLLGTLSDAFDTGTIPTSWTVVGALAEQPSGTGDAVVFPTPTTTETALYRQGDMTDQRVWFKINAPYQNANDIIEVYVRSTPDTTRRIRIYYKANGDGTGILFSANDDGAPDTAAGSTIYDPTKHLYWSIRHDKTAGLVYLQTAPDAASVKAGTWSSTGMRAAFTAPSWLSDVLCGVRVYNGATPNPAGVPSAVSGVSAAVDASNANWINVSYGAATVTSSSPAVDHYYIARDGVDASGTGPFTIDNATVANTTAIFKNLQYSTPYNITVWAHNQQGDGPKTTLAVTTGKSQGGGGVGFADTVPQGNPAKPGGGSWAIDMSDDFVATTLNARWTYDRRPDGGSTPNYTGWGTGEWYDASAVSLANTTGVGSGIGELVISMTQQTSTTIKDPGGQLYRNYKTGVVHTGPHTSGAKYVISPGTFIEARIKVPAGSNGNLWPAFWGVSNQGWPPEIDYFEFGYGPTPPYGPGMGDTHGRPKATWHYGQNSAGNQKMTSIGLYGDSTIDYRGAYHVYGMLWNTNNTVTMYLDGKAGPSLDLYTQAQNNGGYGAQASYSQIIIFSHQTQTNDINAVTANDYRVDWIKVWR